MTVAVHGWGRYPVVDCTVTTPATGAGAAAALRASGEALIARGMGRSYGDSALAPRILSTQRLDCLLDFDAGSGVLRCQAGVTLATILDTYAPRGWFLPVTPGTRFVSVGGAIASDVHGKNHHRDGCFSEFVDNFLLLTARGELLRCSRTENTEVFHATCGGMGLTGIVLEATLRLKPVRSVYLTQETIKAANLAAALDGFAAHQHATYTVAWIDCVARGRRLGRSLLMTGEHCTDGVLASPPRRLRSVPVDMPGWLLNRHSIGAFNTLYYHRVLRRHSRQRVHYEPYFYPLDSIGDWNRLYGRNGFTQYQFVIPEAAGLAGLSAIVQRIADSGRGSFLAVLKTFGPANDNYLSFPLRGYTLALDFKMEPGLLPFLDELDAQVLDLGGRVYLTKDVRMNAATFRRSYPRWEAFQQLRERLGARGRFASLQSHRIGLD